MEEYYPQINTIVLLIIFNIIYLLWLYIKIINIHIDLYDTFMLSMIAILPSLFVFIPGFANNIGIIFGVKTPFAILLGSLQLVVFVVLHRVTLKLFDLERKYRDLIQELALLRNCVEEP